MQAAQLEQWIPRAIAIGMPGIFLVLLVFWASAAVILDYHWRRYSPNTMAIMRFRICFYASSLTCIAAAAGAQILFFT